MNNRTTRHLDLGCGQSPRNPYGCSEVYGVDLSVDGLGANFRAANLALDPIPFADAMFDSVSAYDFLEHVPRLLPTADGRGTRAPFIEVMDEIWRVLRPGGLFYGRTPAYPHPAAFQDPTHVNVIAADTHRYFTAPHLLGRMYGFRGTFLIRRVLAISPREDYEPLSATWADRVRARLRARRGACSHLVWEFEALR